MLREFTHHTPLSNINFTFIFRNTKAPMPELVISSLNTSPPPPPSILQRPMQILKRPTASNSSPATTSQTGTNESLTQREARYHAARERIFGADSEQKEQETVVVRNLRGPTEQGGEPTKGFSGRRRKKGTLDTN